MASFIARQPNGLLCRHSYVVDCITDYNMTEEDYIKSAGTDGEEVLRHYVKSFDKVIESFLPVNMTEEAFQEILKEVQNPKEQCTWAKT